MADRSVCESRLQRDYAADNNRRLVGGSCGLLRIQQLRRFLVPIASEELDVVVGRSVALL